MFARRALQRGDLLAHQRLEFAGARERALDAVSHRRDFAANGLRKRGELFAGHGLGLGQPHRDMGDGGGGLPQLLQPAGQGREAEHDNDGRQRRQREQHRFRPENQRRAGDVFGPALVAVVAAQREPHERGEARQNERHRARPLDLQRLHDGPRRGAIVVGGLLFRAEARVTRLVGARRFFFPPRAGGAPARRASVGSAASGRPAAKAPRGRARILPVRRRAKAKLRSWTPALAARLRRGRFGGLTVLGAVPGSRPRFSASSIASMAWDTGSEAGFCCAISSAFILLAPRTRSFERKRGTSLSGAPRKAALARSHPPARALLASRRAQNGLTKPSLPARRRQ